jgi:protein involved in plasmid replication-relaxation
VLRRLSPRDWQIIRYLHAHRVLTTQHIADALFPSTRTTEMRLLDLYRLRVVDRFRPFTRTGSAPYHWILDEVGAQLIAWDRGEDLKQLGWRRERALGIAASRQLAHRLGVNGFFCALLRAARQTPGCRLAEWRSHPKVSSSSCFVEPDGFAVWEDDGRRLPFYLEYDCGTERLGRLADKLERYRQTVADLDRKQCERWGPPYANLVLFVFPGPLREANARRVTGQLLG